MKNQPAEENKKVEVCPKCQSALGEITTTTTGRKLQRCVAGSWDSATRKSVGCDYVKWHEVEAQQLDEKCPKCSSPLVLAVTRFGKKMKKCSKGGWDKVEKKATGCDYIEWINGTTEPLDEECPECGKKLVLYTTASGKKMKKCSTAGWDRKEKKPTGCTYVYWFKGSDYPQNSPKNENNGEEFLPPEE
jgi:ssDNA-binding Zn-finger/Zn-ribbon topoisomerase 1